MEDTSDLTGSLNPSDATRALDQMEQQQQPVFQTQNKMTPFVIKVLLGFASITLIVFVAVMISLSHTDSDHDEYSPPIDAPEDIADKPSLSPQYRTLVPIQPTMPFPSNDPSHSPDTQLPSNNPSNNPQTGLPSTNPQALPSSNPLTGLPSGLPSNNPLTGLPSGLPSTNPQAIPSNNPLTALPSGLPSNNPQSGSPSDYPSGSPQTGLPSTNPQALPSNNPLTGLPSGIPSNNPLTGLPSGIPSHNPSGSPPSVSPSINTINGPIKSPDGTCIGITQWSATAKTVNAGWNGCSECPVYPPSWGRNCWEEYPTLWAYDEQTKQIKNGYYDRFYDADCLTVDMNQGVTIVVRECSANDNNQKWEISGDTIISSKYNKCLQEFLVNGNSRMLQLQDCDNSIKQRWTF